MELVRLKELKRGLNEQAYSELIGITPIEGSLGHIYYQGKKNALNVLNTMLHNKGRKEMDGCKAMLKVVQGNKYAYIYEKHMRVG